MTELTRTQKIKAGQIQLVPVNGIHRGRQAKLDKPARYYRVDTREFVFADCRECGKSFRKDQLVKGSSQQEQVQMLCCDCHRKCSNQRHANNRSRSADEILKARNLMWPSGVKKCPSCGLDKPFEQFSTDPSRKDGLDSVCLLCANKYSIENQIGAKTRARRRSRAHEQILEDQKRLRPNGMKVCRKCQLELPLSAFSNHILKADGMRDECRSCDNDYQWMQEARAYWDEVGLEAETCFYCSEPATTYDHILARIKSGSDDPHNIVPCCKSHNSSKNGRFVDEWAKQQGFDWDALYEKFVKYGFWIEDAISTNQVGAA